MIARKFISAGAVSLLSVLCLGILIKNTDNANFIFIEQVLCVLFNIFCYIYLLTKKTVLRTALLCVVGMFGFSFMLVPLYNAFCQITGLNGKVDLSVASVLPDNVVIDRQVTVEFDVNYNQDMPWEFKPKYASMTLRPGEIGRTAYYVKNTTKKTMRAQAIPSIAPSKASKYLKKIECFCFNSQQLGPSESANLGLQFYIDPDLPPDVHRLTLSYTLFDITHHMG